MSLGYADQVQKTGAITVDDPVSAMNIVCGWQPRYIRVWNIYNLVSYEFISGMTAGTSLDVGNHDTTQVSLNAAGAITLYTGRAAGNAVTGTVSVTATSPTITGSGTNFIGELAVGDKVTINGETVTILSITSTTVATAAVPFVATASAVRLFDVNGKGEGFTLGTDIIDTAADVVRWVAFR